jgi:signal transduction histidine kinase
VLLGRRQEAERRGVHIEASIVAAPALGDPRLVESLVANLVDNAVRHNLSGGRLDISTVADSGRARLSVSNTGPVVPPAELERLFQPLQQIGSERVGHADGHGLGLAIVQAIAEAHGAKVVATARPGGGLEIDVSFASPVAQS